MKTCKCCAEQKPVDSFSRNAASKDGLQAYCKPCHRQCVKQAKAKRPDVKRANRARHMEKELAANRAYKVANKDALADKGREYRAANAERLKPAKSVWSALRRAMMRQAGGRFAKSDVERLLVRQGGKCAVCKCVLGGKYHVDHVQPLAAGGSNDKSNIQVLCAPCNLAKGAKDPILFMQSRGFLL